MKRGFMEKILRDTWFMHPSTITGLFINLLILIYFFKKVINFVKSRGGFFFKKMLF